jgi:hypothetical protein
MNEKRLSFSPKDIILKHVTGTTQGLFNRFRGRGIKRKRKAATFGRKDNKDKKKEKYNKNTIFSRNGLQSLSGESDVTNAMFACTKSGFDFLAGNLIQTAILATKDTLHTQIAPVDKTDLEFVIS